MRLVSNDLETPTTRRIRLASEDSGFCYTAGQAASLATGGAERTPYSIASAPSDTARDGWLEFLIKVDGTSRFGSVVDRLAPGTRIEVNGPAGRFTLPAVDPGVPLLFIAGGTGIAPLRSILREALHQGHAGRLALVYSARTPDEFAYLAEWRELADQGRIALTLTLTGSATDWAHSRGRAGVEHLGELVRPGTLAFICGPPSMVTDVSAALVSLGIERERIKTENW